MEEVDLLVLCKAVHIYGPSSTAPPSSARARLVMAQEPDPRWVKVTITEPEGGGAKGGYKSASIRLDAKAFGALAECFNKYSSGRFPEPAEGPTEVETRINNLETELEETRQSRDKFAAEVNRLTSRYAMAGAPTPERYQRSDDADAPRKADPIPVGRRAYVSEAEIDADERTKREAARRFAEDIARAAAGTAGTQPNLNAADPFDQRRDAISADEEMSQLLPIDARD